MSTAVGSGSCITHDSIRVLVYPIPQPYFTVDKEDDPLFIFYNQSTLPPPSVLGSVLWDFGDGEQSTLSDAQIGHQYEQPGNYLVTQTVSNQFGCSMSYAQEFTVVSDYAIYIPNTFTPNGDGKNEVFRVEGFGLEEFELVIYDRWGQRIFTSGDPRNGWDGRLRDNPEPAQQGVYNWQVSFRQPSGKSRQLNGHINLLR